MVFLDWRHLKAKGPRCAAAVVSSAGGLSWRSSLVSVATMSTVTKGSWGSQGFTWLTLLASCPPLKGAREGTRAGAWKQELKGNAPYLLVPCLALS